MKTFFEPLKAADKFILIIIALLGCLSLVMLESTVYDNGFVLDRVVIVQAVSYILGFILLITVLHFEYTVFKGWKAFVYRFNPASFICIYTRPGSRKLWFQSMA